MQEPANFKIGNRADTSVESAAYAIVRSISSLEAVVITLIHF